jgi:hypothetical protein
LTFCVSAGVRATQLVYFDEDGGSAGQPRGLYNFDTTTGVSTLRAQVQGTQRLFAWDQRPSDGLIFAAESANDPTIPQPMYTVDIDTGAATLHSSIDPFGYMEALAFKPDNSAAYALRDFGGSSGSFYAIDVGSGAATPIHASNAVRGLIFSPAGALYGFGQSGQLYQIDPVTGVGSPIGAGASRPIFNEDSTFGGTIYQVDTGTGVSTVVGNTGMGTGLLGLIAAPVPEPGGVALLALISPIVVRRRVG